jgi:hypothetical protein
VEIQSIILNGFTDPALQVLIFASESLIKALSMCKTHPKSLGGAACITPGGSSCKSSESGNNLGSTTPLTHAITLSASSNTARAGHTPPQGQQWRLSQLYVSIRFQEMTRGMNIMQQVERPKGQRTTQPISLNQPPIIQRTPPPRIPKPQHLIPSTSHNRLPIRAHRKIQHPIRMPRQ